MVVGIIQLELRIPGSTSLKAKRSVVKKVIEKDAISIQRERFRGGQAGRP